MAVESFFLRARNDTYRSVSPRGGGIIGEPLEGRMGVWFIVCIISQTINDTKGGGVIQSNNAAASAKRTSARATGNINQFMFSDGRESGGQEACIL